MEEFALQVGKAENRKIRCAWSHVPFMQCMSVQGVDLTGIIRSADGGNVDR